MIDSLACCIDAFPGQRNHVWCFAHVINLVAKSLLQQFDSWESNKDPDTDDKNGLLQELVDGIDFETGSEKDNTEGLINVLGKMDEYEWEIFETDITPVCTALVKVSCYSWRLGIQLG